MLIETDFKILPTDVLIFTHIPKCAGSTFREHLRSEYGDGLLSPYHEPGRSEFMAAERGSLEQYTFLSSHDPYGIHSKFNRRPVYFTIVRDPVERIVSFYYYLVTNSSNKLHEVVKDMSLEEAMRYFSARKVPLFFNDQCNFVGNSREFLPAKTRIDETYYVAASVRQYDDLMRVFQYKGILQSAEYEVKNKTKGKPRHVEMSAEIRALIESENQEDRKLVDYVEQKFQQLLDDGLTEEMLRARGSETGSKGVRTSASLDNLPLKEYVNKLSDFSYSIEASFAVEGAVVFQRGEEALLKAEVTNQSSTDWRAVFNGVSHLVAGAKILKADGRTKVMEVRANLGKNRLASKESRQFELKVPTARLAPGAYKLVLDLLYEKVAWFATKGASPKVIRFEVVDTCGKDPVQGA